MGKPSAPTPPDPQETAAAQTGTSVSTAIANTVMGNQNRVGADGSTLTYDQTGTHSFTDPYTGQTYDLPTYTATESLSPEAKAIYDTNQATQANLANLGEQQSGFLGEYLSEPFSYDVGEYENWAGGLYDDINGDGLERQRSQLEARLANQGVVAGSEAYDAEMESLYGGQQRSRDQFMLDAYGTGRSAALQDRVQPINEITALMSGSQVNLPQYQPNQATGIPTTDVAGLINANYGQQMSNYQQEMSQYNSLMGGLFGLTAGGLRGGYF